MFWVPAMCAPPAAGACPRLGEVAEKAVRVWVVGFAAGCMIPLNAFLCLLDTKRYWACK